ncbi:protein pacG [Echria macrotheca]|uniref:Protein pacG n=1 Tax=Echria macrotheca TaxID=438768 RepID=A0AAJ0BD57_9PEZI|nr:protein pacG [Echria macrotheca]
MATFNSLPTLSTGGAGAVDAFDAELAFDESMLVGNELPTLPFTPSAYDFDTFSTTFEDPFSYTARPYDVSHAHGLGGLIPGNGAAHNHHGSGADPSDPLAGLDDGASPQELDNKLLGFGTPIPGKVALVDEAGQFVDPGMTAELYGMFFVAEDVFDNNPTAAPGGNGAGGNGGGSARPLELTCYRRNLWQCSGQVTLPRHVAGCVDEQGRRSEVADLVASISAIESIEGKATEIISIPWKSSNPAIVGAGTGDDNKAAAGSAAPPNVPLDLGSGQELEEGRVSVPVSWKRLQFKHATANNGRRKGLQQHYVVQINLLARMKGGSGELVKIAEIQSGPVIVRGRSPRNFDSRKDVPLTGDKKIGPRMDGGGPSLSGGGIKTQPQDLSQNLQRYHSLGNIQQQSNDWPTTPNPFTTQSSSSSLPPSKKMAVSPNLSRPPVPSWDSGGSTSSRSMFVQQQQPKNNLSRANSASAATLPINLSLSEDERSPNRSSTSGDGMQSPQFVGGMKGLGGGGQGQGASSSSHVGPNGSPLETADMLYEYFPLSLDDWMPPVDAVYRPHVVHHTIVPPEVKAQQSRSKTKRYFAAE